LAIARARSAFANIEIAIYLPSPVARARLIGRSNCCLSFLEEVIRETASHIPD
jgi:hypothetical protein